MESNELQCALCGRGRDVNKVCGKLHSQKVASRKVLAAHHKCMQYSSKLIQYKFEHFGGFDIGEVQKEVKRGRMLKCCWCKQTPRHKRPVRMTGATSGCELRGCRKSFHFYCARLHHITSRRRRLRKKGKYVDLYWVFCSEKHKKKYLETDTGKKEESCTETDDYVEESDHSSGSFDNKIPDLPGNFPSEAQEDSTGPSTSASKEPASKSSITLKSIGRKKTERGVKSPESKDQATNHSRRQKSNSIRGEEPQAGCSSNARRRNQNASSSSESEEGDRRTTDQSKVNLATYSRTKAAPLSAQKKSCKRKYSSDETDDGETLSSIKSKLSQTTVTTVKGNRMIHAAEKSSKVAEKKQKKTSQRQQNVEPLPSLRSLYEDSSESEDSVGKATGHRDTETGPVLEPDSTSHMMTSKTNTILCDAGTSCEDQEVTAADQPNSVGGLEYSESSSDSLHDSSESECLLVIPENHDTFKKVTKAVRSRLAQELGMNERHVHTWNSLHPDLLPSVCMPCYFHDIAQALKKKKWGVLEDLLLNGGILQEKLKNIYMEKVKAESSVTEMLRMQQKETYRNLVSLSFKKVHEKNNNCVGMFICNSDVCYIVILLNDISDPHRNLRRALHHSTVYPWEAGCVVLASFDSLLSSQRQGYMDLECSVLLSWFGQNLCQHPYTVVCLPQEDIFKLDSYEKSDGFDQLKFKLVTRSSSASELPVVVFINRMKTNLIPFEKYLQANISQLIMRCDKLHVVCVFPVDNLSKKECPQIELDSPECTVRFFSAFNPSQKPVTMLLADVKSHRA